MINYRARISVGVVAATLLVVLSAIGSSGVSLGASAAVADIAGDARPAVAVVEAFTQALQRGDLRRVADLLDPSLIVFESGSAEISREEYLGHHAKEDVQFLAHVQVELLRRRANVVGDFAWVASESVIHLRRDGKPKALLTAETFVLRREAGEWRIVHIHWSSRLRPK